VVAGLQHLESSERLGESPTRDFQLGDPKAVLPGALEIMGDVNVREIIPR